MKKNVEAALLTERMNDAFRFAAEIHAKQCRKGTNIPYLAHLLAVCSIVLENGGNEDQAIAALLHDTIEDQAESFGGADALRAQIRGMFGNDVLEIVEGCTDTDVHPKPPWKDRKQAYIQHVKNAPPAVLLVSAADKLHNARSILADVQRHGITAFTKFKGGVAGTLWYYDNLIAVFKDRMPGWLADELERVVSAVAVAVNTLQVPSGVDTKTHTKDRNGEIRYWWQAFTTLPDSQSDPAYARLQRVWWDHTRVNREPASTLDVPRLLQHKFAKHDGEVQLVVTLWENFILFNASDWLPPLLRFGNISAPLDVVHANWSYEWERLRCPEAGRNYTCMADVVVEFEDSARARHVIVVEAKALNTSIGEKETNWDYYLGAPEIAAFGERRYLLFLIDETVREKVTAVLNAKPANVGIITWQQIAGLQIALARERKVRDDKLKSFAASALQYQFVQHNIRPTELSAHYLESEPSMHDVANRLGQLQSMSDHGKPLWRLP